MLFRHEFYLWILWNSCEAELLMKADQQFTLLKKSPLLVSQIQSSKERLHQYFDIIWCTYVSPGVLTWLTRGVSRSADCFPKHLTANRIQRQHLSVIRTSPWYLSHARDSTGQTCWKTQNRRTERAMNQLSV